MKGILYEKNFKGIGIEVTRDMRLQVAAIAVQLSFGLEYLLYLHFSKFVIYRDRFRTRKGNVYKGLVNGVFGTVMLSWKDFQAGNADPHDGVNLGIHEFAHVLWVEDGIDNAEHQFLNQKFKAEWSKLSRAFVEDSAACRRSIFRRYACTNTAEFFAAAVEHFFEMPDEFAKHENELFQALCRLLNQDPRTARKRL